jgi:hypothetical protein
MLHNHCCRLDGFEDQDMRSNIFFAGAGIQNNFFQVLDQDFFLDQGHTQINDKITCCQGAQISAP